MDEFYNERFAKQVERAVLRMDDDEAEMFVRFAAYEIHKADLDANRRLVDARVQEVHQTIAKRVSRSLGSLVSKSADIDVDGVAALVYEVSKGKKKEARKARKEQEKEIIRQWREDQVRRDNRGRFTFERNGHTANYGKNVLVPVGSEKHFNLTGALGETDKRTSTFADEWHKQPSDLRAHSNQRTYERIGAGAKLVSGSGNAKLEAASQLGQFAGRFGPEAEKVVGPHLRRTAYRYRGTERRPDPALINTTNQLSRDVMRHEETENLTPAMRTYAAQRAASSYLMGRLPKKSLSELQRQSGKIPPSEGVILNADGQIITQAVGYMDDHYLPFNLKNLKGLQGGHYVRSRSQGGLTTEDIYTGLVSGARSVTVVSRSGVFTIEFEDDFRGGRRYNDKARQMVARYAHLLDAVQSEKVAQRKLSPDERANIRDEVEREHKDDDFLTSADIEDLIADKEKEYLSRPTMSKDELAEIDAIARKDNPEERQYKLARAELISQKMEEKKARNYRLDGAGYSAALDALKEQFPYYIATVEYRHHASTDKFDNPFTTETDKGYVMPKYNRPAGAMAGYFAEEVNGKGKVPANQTNFQNWSANELNQRRAVADEPGEGEKHDLTTATGKAKSASDRKRARAEAAQEGTAKREADKAIKELVDLFKGIKGVDAVIAGIGDDEDSLRAVLSSNSKRDELLTALKKTQGELKGAGVGTSDAAERARSLHTQSEVLFRQIKKAEPAGEWAGDLMASPDAPFRFKGDAYSPVAPRNSIVTEYQRQATKAGLEAHDNAPGRLTDRVLRDKASLYGYIAENVDSPDYEETRFMKGLIDKGMSYPEAEVIADTRDKRKPKVLADHFAKKSEAYHRMRSLQHNLQNAKPEAEAEEVKATGTAGFDGVSQGKSKGHLMALNTEKGEKEKKGPVEQFELDPELHAASTVATRLGFVQSQLAKQGKSEEASIIKAVRGVVKDYAQGRITEKEFLVDEMQKYLEGIDDDDVRGELDRWLMTRRFER